MLCPTSMVNVMQFAALTTVLDSKVVDDGNFLKRFEACIFMHIF